MVYLTFFFSTLPHLYPTISYHVIYIIGLLYPNTIPHHFLMRRIEIGPHRPRAETTQGLIDSPLRLNRPTPKIRPQRPGLTKPGPKRPIFLELATSLFSLYPNVVALIYINGDCYLPTEYSIEGRIKVEVEPRTLQSITGEPESIDRPPPSQ